MYQLYYVFYYIKKYHELNIIHNQAEIYTLLLFILTLSINYL